jgi:nucleoside-diphosphate-sugar epimerase
MKVLVTGASGFVGSAATAHFARVGWQVVAQSRSAQPSASTLPGVQTLQADWDDITPWRGALQGCRAVVHTAARVHQLRDSAVEPLAMYRLVNTQQTLLLAHTAAAQGVKRFVFLSSVKVNGECTALGKPFYADDTPAPADPYGISKHEAEAGLLEIAAQTGMEVVIVRPPLIYGPGVRANFLTMMRWLERGIPLPLGAIDNRRSLLGLDNLLDLLVNCITHPAAANQTFLASDGQDISTTDLLRALSKALQVRPRLIALPQPWLERSLGLLGRADMAQRLCGNLAVNIEKTRRILDWNPPATLQQSLLMTAQHFQAHQR